MFGFTKRKKEQSAQLSQVLEPEDPVNYNSVLDYLVGLSRQDYDKLLKVSNVYREANKTAAKILGVKDDPTTQLKGEKPTDEEIEDALDDALSNKDLGIDYLMADEPEAPEIKKAQSPSKDKKVKITEA